MINQDSGEQVICGFVSTLRSINRKETHCNFEVVILSSEGQVWHHKHWLSVILNVRIKEHCMLNNLKEYKVRNVLWNGPYLRTALFLDSTLQQV